MNAKERPNLVRTQNVIIAAVVLLLGVGYVLSAHYSKMHHLVFGIGHRVTAENLPLILSAIAWPFAVIFAVLVLRVALRGLIDRLRIKRASVGGDSGPAIDFDYVDTANKPPSTPEQPANVDGISFKDRVRSNVANTYWVGADLMQLVNVILRGGTRDQMLQMFRQANHHMKILRLKDSPLYGRFRKLYDSTERSLESDWTANRRIEAVREIHAIVGSFGRLVEETQPGFSGDAQTSANL